MEVSQETERDLKKYYLENLKTDSEKEVNDGATDYVTRSYLKNVFWPKLFVGALF